MTIQICIGLPGEPKRFTSLTSKFRFSSLDLTSASGISEGMPLRITFIDFYLGSLKV